MRILITGASGFIGQQLSKSLSTEYLLFGISREKRNLGRKVVSIIADLNDFNYTKNIPNNIDCIIHLAQSSRYRDFPEGVADMQCINIDSTVKLLEWARENKVRQFIFTSTANVYTHSVDSFVETSPAIPSSFYGATKLAAEHLVRQYQRYFQVDILRLFTVYGAGQRNMLIPNIIERIKSRQAITLAAGTGVYLTPVFIDDVVHVIKKLITIPTQRESRLMNVCSDEITSLSEITKILETLLNQPALTRITDDEVAYFTGSNENLKKIIGNHQFLDIKTGLKKMVFP